MAPLEGHFTHVRPHGRRRGPRRREPHRGRARFLVERPLYGGGQASDPHAADGRLNAYTAIRNHEVHTGRVDQAGRCETEDTTSSTTSEHTGEGIRRPRVRTSIMARAGESRAALQPALRFGGHPRQLVAAAAAAAAVSGPVRALSFLAPRQARRAWRAARRVALAPGQADTPSQ